MKRPKDKFKITLIVPAYLFPPRRPSGISILAAALNDPEVVKKSYPGFAFREKLDQPPFNNPRFKIEIIDMSVAPKNFDLARYLKKNPPDLAGVTTATLTFDLAAEISRIIQKALPAVPRILGGLHGTLLTEESIKKSVFQIVVRKEGIETMAELALALWRFGPKSWMEQIKNIKGISYVDSSGQIIHNEDRRPILGIEDIPPMYLAEPLFKFPEYFEEKVFRANKCPTSYTHTSFGCGLGCTYCADLAGYSRLRVDRSPEHIVKEFLAQKKRGIKTICIRDETFGLGQKGAAILNALKPLFAQKLTPDWYCQCRADLVDKDRLDLMKAAGCERLNFGVETGDEQLARKIKRNPKLSMKSMIDIFQYAKKLHIKTLIYLLFGLPGQGWASILETARFLRATEPEVMANFNVIPFPGTPLSRGTGRDELKLLSTMTAGRSLDNIAIETADLTWPEIQYAHILMDWFGYLFWVKYFRGAAADFLETSLRMVMNCFRQAALCDLLLRSHPSMMEPGFRKTQLIPETKPVGLAKNPLIFSLAYNIWLVQEGQLPKSPGNRIDNNFKNVELHTKIPLSIVRSPGESRLFPISEEISRQYFDDYLVNIHLAGGFHLLFPLEVSEFINLNKCLAWLWAKIRQATGVKIKKVIFPEKGLEEFDSSLHEILTNIPESFINSWALGIQVPVNLETYSLEFGAIIFEISPAQETIKISIGG